MDSELATNPWALSGNFDVQLDFSNLTDTTGNNNYKVYGRIRIYVSGTQSCYVEYSSDAGTANKKYTGYLIDTAEVFNTDTGTITVTSGKFRITRTASTTFTCYYWSGSSWTQIATGTGFSGAVYLQLTCAYTTTGGGSGGAMSINFDNLTLNSGTLTNGYWRDSPQVTGVTRDSLANGTIWDMSTFLSTEGGTGSLEYDYGCGNSDPPAASATWRTKAQIQALGDPTGRYFKLWWRLISDGSQTATADAMSITNDGVNIGALIGGPRLRGGLSELTGGLT